jgi:hypothetical protein
MAIVQVLSSQVSFQKESYVLTPEDVDNGYLLLNKRAEANSVNAFIDRLAIHEGLDYLLEITEDNKTKIKFIGSFSPGGSEEISEGLAFFASYAVR